MMETQDGGYLTGLNLTNVINSHEKKDSQAVSMFRNRDPL